MDILKDRDNDHLCYRLHSIGCDHSSSGSKASGLGTISGAADTYWGHNKGRSMEGTLVKVTRVVAVLFIVLAVVLNLKIFN